MKGPYVNDDGDLWIERGTAPWNLIQAEAAAFAPELSDSGKVRYLGIEADVRVSDLNEYVHSDDDGCADYQEKDADDPAFVPCCRTVQAHHFRAEDA